MKYLKVYLKNYTAASILAPLFKMLEATFDLLVPLVVARIINVGIANGDTGYILGCCGILILMALVGLACSFTAQYFAAKAAIGSTTGLRHLLFAHIQSLGFSEMDTIGTSTLITRMTSDLNQVQSGVNLFLRLFLRSPFIVFGSMVMAFAIDVQMALIFVVAIPVLSVIVFGIMRWTSPRYKKIQSRLDAVTGVRVIRAFGREKAQVEQFAAANDSLVDLQLHVGHISALMNPLTYVAVNLGVIAILYAGAWKVEGGILLSGGIVALVNYMNQILVELVKLANLIVSISRALASLGRVEQVLDTKTAMEFPKTTQETAGEDSGKEAVRFDHVGLTYAGAGAESLTDISFAARSSLVNLIPRFYDATAGTVTLMGRPIGQWDRESLRDMVGVVMQKAQLFAGTIRSNLLWGNPDATEEELWEALRLAQAEDFVRAKSKGLDDPV